MKNLGKIGLILACVLAMACAGKRRVEFESATATTENTEKAMLISVKWLKNKKDTVDIYATIKNQYDEPVAFKRKDIQLTIQGEVGALKKSDFSGELAANGGAEQGLLIFGFTQVPEKGKATLAINNIKSEDGKKTYPPLKIELPLHRD